MPVVRAEDPKKIELDDEDQKKFHYRAPQAKLDEAGPALRDKDDIKKGKKGKEKSAMEYTRSASQVKQVLRHGLIARITDLNSTKMSKATSAFCLIVQGLISGLMLYPASTSGPTSSSTTTRR